MANTDFVTRAEWGARPPKSISTNIRPEGITGHYEGGKTLAGDHSRCASIVRAIQAYHQDHQGWSDIAYTSLCCLHGVRYEGRGPGVRTSASGTNEANTRSYAVCVMAGTEDPLTDAAKWAMIDEATRLGRPLVWGHKDWYATACPGDVVYEWIHAGAPAPGSPPPVPQPPPILPPEAPDMKQIAWTKPNSAWARRVGLGPAPGQPQGPAAVMLYESGIATHIEDIKSVELMKSMGVRELGVDASGRIVGVDDLVFQTYTFAAERIA